MGELQISVFVFVLYREHQLDGVGAQQHDCKKCEVSFQLQKSTLNWLSNGTLVLWVILWCLKQGKPLSLGNPNMWKQTLRITSMSYKRWPPSSYSGGHTATFSYPLMAEIVSLFPLPQYITLSYSCLMKKPFTSNGVLQYIQDWSNFF